MNACLQYHYVIMEVVQFIKKQKGNLYTVQGFEGVPQQHLRYALGPEDAEAQNRIGKTTYMLCTNIMESFYIYFVADTFIIKAINFSACYLRISIGLVFEKMFRLESGFILR